MLTRLSHTTTTLVMVGIFGAAGSAFAQVSPEPDDSPTRDGGPDTPAPMEPEPVKPAETTNTTVVTPTVIVEPAPSVPVREESTLERYGIAMSFGGGVSGFTSDVLRSTTDDGGNWGVRLAVGTRLPIGFEAAYFGSAQGIDALGLDGNAVLLGNGLQGNLRVNLIDANIQPFLFGGIAWRHYSIENTNENTSDILGSDDVLEVPMWAGIAFKYRGAMLDARGEFRYANQEDLVPEFADNGELTGNGTMHRYGVNVNVGFAF